MSKKNEPTNLQLKAMELAKEITILGVKAGMDATKTMTTIVDNYACVTDACIAIQIPVDLSIEKDIAVVVRCSPTEKTKKVYTEVYNYVDAKANGGIPRKIYTNSYIKEITSRDYKEWLTDKFDSFPNFVQALKYVGRKKTLRTMVWMHSYDEARFTSLASLTTAKAVANKLGYKLNEGGLIREYDRFTEMVFGDCQIIVSNLSAENVPNSGLIIAHNEIKEDRAFAGIFGGYEDFIGVQTDK